LADLPVRFSAISVRSLNVVRDVIETVERRESGPLSVASLQSELLATKSPHPSV
jgi:hypothetical protein